MAEDYEIVLSGAILPCDKRSTQGGVCSQNREKLRGYQSACQPHRLANPCQIEFVTFGVSRDIHCAYLLAHGHKRAPRIRARYADQFLGLLIGKRTKQNAIDRTERRRIRADAKGERNHGNRGETGTLRMRSP